MLGTAVSWHDEIGWPNNPSSPARYQAKKLMQKARFDHACRRFERGASFGASLACSLLPLPALRGPQRSEAVALACCPNEDEPLRSPRYGANTADRAPRRLGVALQTVARDTLAMAGKGQVEDGPAAYWRVCCRPPVPSTVVKVQMS